MHSEEGIHKEMDFVSCLTHMHLREALLALVHFGQFQEVQAESLNGPDHPHTQDMGLLSFAQKWGTPNSCHGSGSTSLLTRSLLVAACSIRIHIAADMN